MVNNRKKLIKGINSFFVFLDLSQRVDSVKEENLKLRSENQVLGQYIENLMSGNIIKLFACYLMNIYFQLLFSASSVFQSTSPNSKKK